MLIVATEEQTQSQPLTMDKYVYKTTFTVPFSDIDMLGHVNNAKYLTYFETARTEHLFNIERKTKFMGLGVIMARVEIDYKSPARWHDELTLKMRTVSVGNSSWVYEYEIVNEKENNRVIAVGKSVQVAFDYKAQKPVPIPPAGREMLLREIEETRDQV